MFNIFTGEDRSEERCPGRPGHLSIFGNCCCDVCNQVVEPEGDWAEGGN
jgi:hypothetical protein